MAQILQFLTEIFSNIWGVICGVSVGDVLDVLILTYLIYKGFQLVHETHAGQLLKGIFILLIIDFIVRILDMTIMKVVLQTIWSIGLLAIIVLFQPELRHLLEQIGRSKLGTLGRAMSVEETEISLKNAIEATCRACVSLSNTKTGALIVFENNTILNDVIDSGSKVDAETSSDLLCNIFYPKAPLHDGAVVMRKGRIHSAACILPLTKNINISRDLGTRHRSAIGMSENSDAVVVVVSEETGIISVAYKGVLTRDFDAITLKTELEKDLVGALENNNDDASKNPFKRMGWFK